MLPCSAVLVPGSKVTFRRALCKEQLLAISKKKNTLRITEESFQGELIEDVCKIEGTMIDSFRGTNIAFCSGPL